MAQQAEGAPPTPVGRPRDPEVETRAMTAALEVYGTHGWSGFTFGKVAALAHIGKSSLYLRWPDKAALLLDAFRTSHSFYTAEGEEGPVFTDTLRDIVRHRLHSYFSPGGTAVLRLSVERFAAPEVMGEIWAESMGSSVQRIRHLLRQAVESGDLRPDTSVVHLGDAIEGGVLMHAIATPMELRDRAEAGLDEYAEELLRRTVGPWLAPDARQAYLPDAVDTRSLLAQ